MTQSNPRIGQTSYAASGMGAIGGPRGVAAGGLRILIEFITSYDPAAVKQLEDDLSRLDYQEKTALAYKEKAEVKLDAIRDKLHRAEMLRQTRLDAVTRKAFKDYEQTRLRGGTPQEIRQSRENYAAALQAFRLTEKGKKLTDEEAASIMNIFNLRKRESTLLGQISHHNSKITHEIHQQKAGIQAQLAQYARLGGRMTGRLAGLAIGAIGGILGGSLLGVGFELAQAGLEKIGEAIEDLIDPSKKVREAIKEIGDEINKIAESEGLDKFEATAKYLGGLGVVGAKPSLIAGLASASDAARLKEVLDNMEKLDTLLKNPDAQYAENIQRIKNRLIEADKAAGDLHETVVRTFVGTGYITETVTDDTYYYVKAIKEAWLILQNLNAVEQQAANMKGALAFRTITAANAMNAFSAAAAAAASAQTGAIQGRIEAVSAAGPSARTRGLQAALERAQSAGGGGGNAAALRENAEERQLILLKMRLRLMGTAINLERYSGKFLLAAIDAKIAALNKQAAAEDRINRLQDLRYRMSQPILRKEGESIRDYLERRAQENKAFIKEGQDLAREAQIEKLENLKEKTELEVQLRENAEARMTAAAGAGANARIKLLQKQLAASQAADAKATEAKKKELEKQQKDAEKNAQVVSEILTDEFAQGVWVAARASKNMTNLWIAEGKLRALRTGKATIEGWVQAFGLPSFIATPYIQKINGLIAQLEAWESRYYGGSGQHPLQHGGVIRLTNASTAFGGNIRTGEGGEELGVVLSNRVVKALKEQQPIMFGDITINRSDDPYRDNYQLRKEIKQAVREALS